MKCCRITLLAILSLGPADRTFAGDKDQAPTDRPRGTIAFASQTPRGWDIYVTDVATRKATKLTDNPALDFNAAAAPDGKRVAFVSERDGNMEIYFMNPDGSDPK